MTASKAFIGMFIRAVGMRTRRVLGVLEVVDIVVRWGLSWWWVSSASHILIFVLLKSVFYCKKSPLFFAKYEEKN